MIYFTSDLHFGHNKDFVFAYRGFANIQDMNMTLVDNINSTVMYDDTLYILGDVMLGDVSNLRYLKQIVCSDIHIILGNHDTDTRVELYKELFNVTEVSCASRFKYNGYHFFLSHFPCLTGNIEKENLKGTTLNLCGHTHQKNPLTESYPWMYNVGVDANNLTPVSIEVIIEQLLYNWDRIKNA